ncbi:hypothetical protein [Tropicimonas sp. IMCC34043]|uniref:hypothetical protein n=1 Tax=Tropicimonas sp. IMCC34043 TaxID=2248760 RepID=UPI0018E5741D|nr:hypothetical protein [Tropicimonas sp. IMCC34043]
MKTRLVLALFAATFLTAACSEPKRYPVTGEACTPSDPVKDISVEQCAPVS